MKIISVSNEKDIEKITELIHDNSFNLDYVQFDSSLNLLKIKFYRRKWKEREILKKYLIFKKYKISTVESFLNIYNVKDFTIEDEAQIGIYEFDKIKFNSIKKILTITSCFPLLINITVTDLKIEIEDLDKIVKEEVFYSIL